MHCNVKLVHEHARPPQKNPEDPASAGYDLFAPEDTFVDPLERKLVPLGFKTEFAGGTVGLLCDRSGMANKGITVLGGVIDSSYRGEWKVILYNTTSQPFHIKRGDKITQVLFLAVESPEVQVVQGELAGSPRGERGFGSSGN